MKYRCRRECLVQTAKYHVNRAFQPGQTLTIDCDLEKELPSIAPFFQPLPGESPPVVVDRDDLLKELKALKKDELFVRAEKDGLKPTDSMTKSDIIALILNPPEDPDLIESLNREPRMEREVETLVAPSN